MVDPEYFWQSNSLGTAQLDGFKAWLKDAEINDAKNQLTKFGELIQQIYIDDINLTWELILINLSYNSFVVKWFLNNINIGQQYDRKTLENLINEQGFSSKGKTVVGNNCLIMAYCHVAHDSILGDNESNGTADCIFFRMFQTLQKTMFRV